MVLLGFRGGSASPPQRSLRFLFSFIPPAIKQIRSEPVPPTRPRDVPALNAFLHDLPLLFRGSIYAWFPAHAASCLEALNHTEFGSLVSAGSTTRLCTTQVGNIRKLFICLALVHRNFSALESCRKTFVIFITCRYIYVCTVHTNYRFLKNS